MGRFRLIGILTSSITSVKKVIEDDKQFIKDELGFLKVLEHNTFFSFYNCYAFNKKSRSFVYDSDRDRENLDLYSHDLSLDINISAIVGKNGSGKSSLLELLYLANYNLGCEYKLLTWFEKHGEPIKSGDHELQVGDTRLYEKKNLHFSILFERDNAVFDLQFEGTAVRLHKSKGFSKKGEINFSKTNLFNTDKKGEKNFEHLYYTIAVNYSIYGLNSKHLGEWINPLFHKNDGYRTPLVINPMRNEGNFDINDETDFSYNRILANLVSKRLKQKAVNKESQSKSKKNEKIFLTDNQYVVELEFVLKDSVIKEEIKAIEKGISGPKDETFLVMDIISEFFEGLEIVPLLDSSGHLPFAGNIYTYLKNKYNKIVKTYKEYEDIRNDDKLSARDKQQQILTRLKGDNSHVTYKFRQAINFLNICIDQAKRSKWTDTREIPTDPISFSFSLDDLIEWMGIEDNQNITEFLPPSIFQTKVWLSSDKGRLCSFGDLSSGEQQYINSVQTILYHINNIDSVHQSGIEEKVFYKNINVIYDEIELYFHPEYQQKYVQHLISELGQLELKKKQRCRLN
jgi:hypothetical protein